MTRYYSTQRPIAPGTFPRRDGKEAVTNFDDKTYCEEIGREARGYIEYSQPLTVEEAEAYELVRAARRNAYTDMKVRQQAEFNRFPIGAAFNDNQFREMMADWGLTEKDTDKVLSIGFGAFIRKTDKDTFDAMFMRHEAEMQEAIAADTTGEGFIRDMFYAELADHEYGYTMDFDETLMALGLTAEEINADERLQTGLLKAAREITGED